MKLMSSQCRLVFLLVLGLLGGGLAWAADTTPATRPATVPATKPAGPPFLKDIEAFEAADRKHPPAPGGVLFLGSSSIVKWKTLAQDFPGVPVINRGFGGSTIPDSVRYAPRIVTPYKPRLIVFYAGDNDLAAGHSPERILADFKDLVAIVHKDLPDTRLLFVAVKPSPARAKLFDKAREANRMVREYAEKDPKLGYVDVWTPMLGDDGKAREELFSPDHLHMNAKGYELWTSIIGPRLKEP